MAQPQRDRGSLVNLDASPLEVFQFQWEPKHKEANTTKFGKVDIIGRRLPIRHWVGEGESSVEVVIQLTGPAYTDLDFPSYREVLAARKVLATGASGANGNISQMDRITLSEAQVKLKQAKIIQNQKVMKQVAALQKLKEPWPSTGVPPRLLLNMGGIYLGRKFVLETLNVDYETHNYSTMEPTEATVTLKLADITDYRKV